MRIEEFVVGDYLKRVCSLFSSGAFNSDFSCVERILKNRLKGINVKRAIKYIYGMFKIHATKFDLLINLSADKYDALWHSQFSEFSILSGYWRNRKIISSKRFGVMDTLFIDNVLSLLYVKSEVRIFEEFLLWLFYLLDRSGIRLIIVDNDASPFNRVLVLFARYRGISVIEIQHGIYTKRLPLTTGIYSNILWLWGDYFKEIYEFYGIRDSGKKRLLVGGYPKKFSVMPEFKYKDVAIFVGQNFYVWNESLEDEYLNLIIKINRMLKNMGITLEYKPHPGDTLEFVDRLIENGVFVVREDIEKLWKDYGLFIGVNSTALPESFMRGKKTVQITDFPIPIDNLQKLGGVSVTIEKLDNFPEIVKSLWFGTQCEKFNTKISEKYIRLSPDVPDEFIRLVKEVI